MLGDAKWLETQRPYEIKSEMKLLKVESPEDTNRPDKKAMDICRVNDKEQDKDKE